MTVWQKDYPLPADLGFSFEGFLQGALDTPSRLYPDQTGALVQRLESLASPLAQALGLGEVAFTRTATTTAGVEEAGLFAFKTERQEIRFEGAAARWSVVLDRLDNGHLGCFEDDVSARFEAGERQVELRCYLFLGKPLSLETRGLSAAQSAAVEQVVVRALGLRELREGPG